MPWALRSEKSRKCSVPTLISAHTPSSSMARILCHEAAEIATVPKYSRSIGDWNLLMLRSVDAHVVHEHGLRIDRGGVRWAGPVAPDGDVKQQKIGVIENPGAGDFGGSGRRGRAWNVDR